MAPLIKIIGFSLGLTMVFTVITNTLPQMRGEAPVEEVIDLGSLDMDALVVLGEKLFHARGSCALCHNNAGRAPDLLAMDVVAVSRQRLSDPRYGGAADSAESYLLESMMAPSAFVVAGYGVRGSNDTESPMFDVRAAPAELSPLEVDAIIAFMQYKDGHPITVSLPIPGEGAN